MRHSRTVFLPLALFGALLLSGPVAAQDEVSSVAEEQGLIRGIVRDAVTGREVADARVALSSNAGMHSSDSTNSNGQFTLDSVPRGSYTITVDHPDYIPLTQQINTDGHPTFGVQLSMRKKLAAATPAAPEPSPAPAAPSAPSAASARATGIPRPAQEAMNRGMELLYVKSDPRGSIGQFERAIREYPDFFEAYTQIALARTSLGDPHDAEKAFRKAIELSQEQYADAYAGLAVLLSNEKHFGDAEAAARKLIELNPDDWRGHGERARALHGLRRFQDAEAPAEQAAKLAPENPTVKLLLSSIHLQLNKLPTMLEDLDAYLKLVPRGAESDRMRELRVKVQQAIDGAQNRAPAR